MASRDQGFRNFAYLRRSSDDKKQIASIEDQIPIVNKLTASYGVIVPENCVFKDTKTAMKTGARIGFNQMMETIDMCTDKGYKCRIFVWKACRLARNAEEGGKIVDRVRDEKLEINSHVNGIFNEKNFSHLNSEFGHTSQTSFDIRMGVRKNNENKVEKGIYPGKSPLGYTFDPNKPKGHKDHIPHFNWHQLREWLEMLLTGEYTVLSSLEIMTAKGLRGNKGKPISLTTAYRFLHDIFNTGLFKVLTGPNYGVHKGIHKPLMTLTEYNHIQKIISKGKQSKGKLLWFQNQLFTCEECNCAITAETKSKRLSNGTNKDYTYVRCTKKKGRCTQKTLTPSELENQIKNYILDINMTPKFIEWLRKVLKKQKEHEFSKLKKDQEHDTRKLNETRKELDKVFDKKIEGFYANSPERYDQDKAYWLKQERLIQESMTGDKTAFYRELMEETVDFIERLNQLSESNNPAVKRLIVQILGSNWTIKNQRMNIEPKEAFVALKRIQKEFEKESSLVELNLVKKRVNLTTQSDSLLKSFPLGTAFRDWIWYSIWGIFVALC